MWCCSITSPQRRTSSSSSSLTAEFNRLTYAEGQQSAADRPAPRRQLSHQSSAGPVNLPSASYDDSGDPGHIFSLTKPEDADVSIKSDFPKETPVWRRASYGSSKALLPGDESSQGFESTSGAISRSRALGLDSAPRHSAFNATEHTSDTQTLSGAARQEEPGSVSASATRSSDWHPLMADSRQDRSASDEQYSRQSGPSQHGHAHRQSSKLPGLSDPAALILTPSQGAASAQQPVHASGIGRHGQFEMAASSASHAVSGSQGIFPKVRDTPPAESQHRHESAVESAAEHEQMKPESTEAMLQRIHRSLRKPISQPKPGLHTHSLDTGHAPILESGSKQDSGKWWRHTIIFKLPQYHILCMRLCFIGIADTKNPFCPPTQLQQVHHITEGFRVNRAGAGASVGEAGVLSDAAAPDDVKGSPSAHVLAKSPGTTGMQFYCEMLCLLQGVQHFEVTICTCWQQSCAGSSCTSCMRSCVGSQHIIHTVCQCALSLLILLHDGITAPP